ncbi:MAG: hypothetical protein CM1200mP29_17730 [Verrucomicrobiota bacterium]|nr:MAG: hypothetical protein CM1200mP29_17730 [Verrucomicrobiota bacterium]
MSNETNYSAGDKLLFWGCFIALITTAFAFITRAFLVNTPDLWPAAFWGGCSTRSGTIRSRNMAVRYQHHLFSLIIDNVGYKTAMIFSFVCYVVYAGLALTAHGIVTGVEGDALAAAQKEAYGYLYWGSVILGLGNGTVEAFINPVVATMFHKEKTKWLNILHAGWPGGLVLGGVLTILLGEQAAADWRILIYLIAIPAIVFLVMLIKANFPLNERVASGTSYKEMLAEFGVIGAFIAFFLIFKQLGMVFGWSNGVTWGIILVTVIGYGVYCQSIGRPILIFLCLIMMPLATLSWVPTGPLPAL